ncbi:MAG: S41 family peptidase [Flavobacteriales bacterium]|nr:S41 family peptidase [Flavobacteriales bacterium]
MSDRPRAWWVLFLPLFLGVAAAVGFLAGARLGAPRTVDAGLFSFQRSRPSDKLDQVMDLIDRNYVDSVQEDKLVDEVLQDMLQKLDPHSYYISAAELRAAQEPLEGSFMGIGVEFALQRDTIVVISPVEGGPSAKLGIRAGDRIVSADGKALAGVHIANEDVMKALRGPAGSKVTIGIVRGREAPFDVEVERGEIPINSVTVALLEADGTGYIKLSRFARTTEEEFLTAAKGLLQQGMKRLVLDLRGNGGGYLNAATGICDMLLPAGSRILYTEGRATPRRDFLAKPGGLLVDLPLAVLIDEGSASASEIVAGAVQDNDRGTIVGRRSFGKGLVQEHVELEDHSAVRITTARYYTPSGRSIQRPYGQGIDYDEEMNERFSHGEQFSADSIHLDSTQRFRTLKGRTVYGGGGIMPDVFVPADTAERSAYLNELFFSGAINQFAFDLADRKREQLKAYPSPEAFVEGYSVGRAQLQDLAKEAASLGVPMDTRGMERSERLIAERLKAGVARNIWGEAGYYRVLLGRDSLYHAARRSFLGATP